MKLKGVLSTAIAIASGILVLAGYFFAHPASGGSSLLVEVQTILLEWAITLAGFAILIGIINLFLVHLGKIRSRRSGSAYSLLLILALGFTFLFGLFMPVQVQVVFTTIQLPVEASLMAILAVTLTYASIRLLHRRFNLLSVVFLVTALLILLGTAPLPFIGTLPVVSDWLRPFITHVLAASGARGILLGVALGTLTTGLRILFGTDRPYEGSK